MIKEKIMKVRCNSMKLYQYYMQKEHRFELGEDIHILYYEEDGDIYEEYLDSSEIEATIEELEDCIYLRVTELDELSMKAYRSNQVYFTLSPTVIHFMEEEEESITFVFEKWQSRMLQIQFTPGLPIEFGLYYEICTDCDE